MKRTIYKIHDNDEIVFLDMDEAEKYLLRNYSEYISCKDQFTEYCEDMIYEEEVTYGIAC